jgi:hypothetical protein
MPEVKFNIQDLWSTPNRAALFFRHPGSPTPQPAFIELGDNREVTPGYSLDRDGSVSEQLALPGSRTNPTLVAARLPIVPIRRTSPSTCSNCSLASKLLEWLMFSAAATAYLENAGPIYPCPVFVVPDHGRSE